MNWFWPDDGAIQLREASPRRLLHISPDTWGLNFRMRYRAPAASEAAGDDSSSTAPGGNATDVGEEQGSGGDVIAVDFPHRPRWRRAR
ncbi:hypothetical protein EV383_6232 [Pseudonocardia sediminis]|uniref:Uncharacterized protein n=1 Tax=Pseudonocardia sediminis TaxID=1397368 RepID=A0A4V6ME00_PSEST|nr:hypothetical protein [Pseudonocardia sediminis]RZT75492.1 hypothetical protein EV383_6232 [Pseudonocardia sediminis]